MSCARDHHGCRGDGQGVRPLTRKVQPPQGLLLARDHRVTGIRARTVCMPCSRVSSDHVVLGPVTAVQSGFDVWGRLARSGEIWGHTGRPPARCLWVGSFSGGPRSEPDGRLSAHPALQRLSRAVRGWLPRAAGTQDSRHRFGVLHYAYLLASGILQPPGPPSPCGRLSRPPRRGVTPATTTGPLSPWDSRPVGDPAFVPVIRASAT